MRLLVIALVAAVITPVAAAVPIPNYPVRVSDDDQGVAFQGSMDGAFFWLDHPIICGAVAPSPVNFTLTVKMGTESDILRISYVDGAGHRYEANATLGHPGTITVAACPDQWTVTGVSVQTVALYGVSAAAA